MAEPIKWITVNGRHVPIFDDDTNSKKIDELYKKLKDDGYRPVKGTMADTGEEVVMVANGAMADGSTTYVRGDSDDVFSGRESDGYIRQYQRDRKRRFYLLTEDKAYY